ncbi:uncharacterized protein CLUP02_04963 [Colletotrichum lupini]|uniref:Uncharacterized protein n=1 Tax=Colletotrichum lupini TaxID=145971 RepID=A0A9Q8SLL5_9PEZI|nr:uncharacterized protein CLUP02_04963 [Colletotrichum lupini]UQC79483.1 hypothetical protein CLUP02_04963 [Colletotrichum lupini]
MVHPIIFAWWTPPPGFEVKFADNCVLFGNFVHSIIRTSPTLDYCAIDINALYSLVNFSLPSNLTEVPEIPQVASWYLTGCGPDANYENCFDDTCLGAVNLKEAVRSEINNSANMTCIGELRSSLGIQGNADIAGIGVMVTFCIEAWLVAGFLAAKIAKYARGDKSKLPDWLDTVYRNLADAFEVILPAFYWSSVLLSLGIVAASVLTAAAASGNGQDKQLEQWRAGEDYTVYDSQLSALASLFSIQATFMASLMLQEHGRRLHLLNLAIIPVLAILGVLLLALLGLTVWYVANLPRDVNRLLQGTLRSNQTVRVFLLVSISVTVFMMAMCGITAALAAYMSRAKKDQTKQSSPQSMEEGRRPSVETIEEGQPLKTRDTEEGGLSSAEKGSQSPNELQELSSNPKAKQEKESPTPEDGGGKSSSTRESSQGQAQQDNLTSNPATEQAKGFSARQRELLDSLLTAEFRIVLALMMGMMLATLGMFFEFRRQTINSGAAGDPQLEWSFGQIVVLTTWVPVILHFWCTLAVGIIPALEGYMPAGYAATAKSNTAEAAEPSDDGRRGQDVS